MAGKNVDINFRTTANTRGAKEAEKAAEGVERALDEVTDASSRQGRKAQQSGRETEEALERVENDAERLREELDKIDGLDPKVRSEVENVAGAMDRAAESGRKMASAKQQVGKSSRNSGLAVLEFSRAIEDAQYGIRGVLNNIPQLVGFLGGGAGLAGAISLAAVGLTQLVEYLGNFEAAAGEAAETLEAARNQIDEFYKESARDGTAAFQAQVMRVVEALGKQNSALQTNLRLTREKRKAELRVAEAGQGLEIAQIAAEQAAGQITDEEAEARVRAVKIARIRAAAEEEIIKAQEEEQLVFDRKREAYDRQIENATRLSDAEAKQARLIEELNVLRSRQEIRTSMEEKGAALIDESSGAALNPFGVVGMAERRARGQGLLRDARTQFSESDRKRLIELESVILPQIEEMVETLQSNAEQIEIERETLLVAQSEAVRTRQLVESTEIQVADLREQTMETEAAAGRMTEAQAQLSSGLSDLQSAAADSVSMTEADRRLVETANNQFRKVLADDDLTARELQETSQVLGRLSMSLAGASKQNTEMINSLQVSVDQLSRALATTQAENVRLSQQIKTLNGRQ